METKTYEEVLNETGALCWTTVGVSMRPLIREGKDMIVIQKQMKPPQKYDVVLFRRPGVTGRGSYVLHRILKVNGDGTYWIVGDNCCSGETVREENILGVLTKMVRGGKLMKLDGFAYRAYIRLWCAPYRLRFFVLKYKSYPRKVVSKLIRTVRNNSAN